MKPTAEDRRKARAKRKRIEREAKRKERVAKAKSKDKAATMGRARKAFAAVFGTSPLDDTHLQ